jgi:RsiW-degrading membrane proteinase PrsW (M82 family)
MVSPAVFVAFVSGLIPALLWLTFWLLEDRVHPEPKQYIFFCFLAGMAVVIPFELYGSTYGIVLPLEKLAVTYLAPFDLKNIALNIPFIGYYSLQHPITIFAWATIEEVAKFAAAYFVALRARVFDEPLDAVIYMVTVALGFSAAENMLFLMNPISHGLIFQAVVTGDLRFIGATLLHTLASATIGLSLAYAYYKSAANRILAAFVGLILAVALHTLFNFFILGAGGNATFWVFLIIWLGIIAVLLGVERVKKPMRRYS